MGKIDPAVEKELKAMKKEIDKLKSRVEKDLAPQITKNQTAITHNAKVVIDKLGGVVKNIEDVKKEQIRKM